MLTKDQQNYLEKISSDKTVRIIPYDPQVIDIVASIKEQIKDVRIDLEVKFMGASALGISGQGDIDLYVFCQDDQYDKYLPQLENLFGPRLTNRKTIDWEFDRGGHKVELSLTDPSTTTMKDQIKIFEILKDNPVLLGEYEMLKKSCDGNSFREYMAKKYEFYNKILAKK